MDTAGGSDSPKLKRPRAAQACDLCRVKKNKCDELYPCSHCKSRNAKCVYRGAEMRRSRLYNDHLYQLEEQVKALSAAVSLTKNGRESEALQRLSQPPGSTVGPPNDGSDIHNPNCDYRRASFSNGQMPNTQPSKEVSGVNKHTRNVEFYGSSSSVALLSRVRKVEDGEGSLNGEEDEEELVSSLHNPAFSPGLPGSSDADKTTRKTPSGSVTHYQHCRPFLDNFFTTLHYLHPIVDKSEFLTKCAQLWTGNTSSISQSFIALYYSTLSLGALVGIREDEAIDGIENLQWSRMFFEEARTRANKSMVTDLEMVQCYFFLAKVCQNELNHHSAYMYGGLSVRTALAIGINREPQPNRKRDPALTRAEARTWWGLYSLETEMSFALGRPDSLGADVYHNRNYPAIRGDVAYSDRPAELMEPPHCAIIKAMVDFSRITRNVVLGMYLADSSLLQSIGLARQIEQDLECWLEALPAQIRPVMDADSTRSLKATKDPQYAKKQRLVLKIRYHNLRILLFGSFLTKLSTSERANAVSVQEQVAKCLDSAKQTIEIIYETCQHHDFFRTWFYNTMYTLFATSIILVYISQETDHQELVSLHRLVEMAIEIFEIMDESVVAMKAAKMIRGALAQARTNDSGIWEDTALMDFDKTMPWNSYAGLLDFMDGDVSVNLPFPLGDPTEMYPL